MHSFINPYFWGSKPINNEIEHNSNVTLWDDFL